MTITRMALMAAMAAAAAAAAGQAYQPHRKVTVYLLNGPNIGCEVLVPAKTLASEIYAGIGVDLEWTSKQPVAGGQAIVMELVTGTPNSVRPGALAYAMPFEGVHITVFFNRIADMHPPDRVLAHVMVHEITHILEGVDYHSDRGIMKAHWNLSDFYLMRTKKLAFAESDMDLIYAGLAARARRAGTLADAR